MYKIDVKAVKGFLVRFIGRFALSRLVQAHEILV